VDVDRTDVFVAIIMSYRPAIISLDSKFSVEETEERMLSVKIGES
jgi:hypothetical protein